MLPFTKAESWPNMGLIVIAGPSGTTRAKAALASSLGLGIFIDFGAAIGAILGGPMRDKLLWAGVVGPLLFIIVFFVEGFTRPGYSQTRNFVSQLATGETGWLQVVNFLVCGTLVLLFVVGLRQTLAGTRGAIGAPVFLGLYALSLFVAGVFSTDPALGYPPGA